MIIFAFDQFKNLKKTLQNKISGLESGYFSVNRFANQEIYIILETNVEKKDCLILGSIAPPEEQLFSLLLLADTLKKEGASKIIVCLPYLSYGRADKNEFNKSLTIRWIGQLFKASSVDELITFEAHSELDQKLFSIPFISISTSEIFAQQIVKLKNDKISLVAPDEGAINLCQVTDDLIDLKSPIVYFKKRRNKKGAISSELAGEVKSQAIILDDILDTGATLLSCTNQLKKIGVTNIIIMVTHGLFTGNKWEELWQNNVSEIYSTDTVLSKENLSAKKIKTLPIASFAATKLKFYLGL